MRIGVDATCWTNRRGYGRFARALLTAALELDSSRRYVFFVDDDSTEFPLPSGVEMVRIRSRVPTVKAAAADGARSPGDLWTVSRAISAAQVDVIYFPSVYSYVPVFSRVPILVTIHDVIPERFPQLVFPTLRGKLFWRAKVALACAQARLIVTVSEYSRRCLVQELRLPPERIRVVSEAGDPAFLRLTSADSAALFARLGLPPGARILAYVGGFSPHKNLPMLVDVFAALARSPEYALVHLLLVGDYLGDVFYSGYRPLAGQVAAAGLQARVHFTGYMGDDDLRTVFNVADAVVLPSFCEGFGLPAVEGAACGAPAIVTTESPLPQLLGEGALGVPPGDREGWRRALADVLGDSARRERMRAAAIAAASRLSWRSAARQLLDIFDEVTARRGATP